MNRRTGLTLIAILAVLLLDSCGGGGGSSGSTSTVKTPTIPLLTIVDTSLPQGVTGKSYSAQLQVTGGTAPYTWSPSAVSWLPWLTLDSKTGALSGTIPASIPAWTTGAYAFSVSVSDSGTPVQTVQKVLQIYANGQITIISTANPGTRGVPYIWLTGIQGGQPNYALTVDSGMPAGLQASIEGTTLKIQGTPTEAGNFTIQFRIKDSATPVQEVVQSVPLAIDTAFSFSKTDLRSGVVGRAYSDNVTTANGVEPLTWSVKNLPAGLILNSATGEISGIPTITQYDQMYITVTDSSSPARTISRYVGYNIRYEFAFSAPSLQEHVGVYIFRGLQNEGGVQPLKVSIISSSLPPEFTFLPGGTISGTATRTGTYSFTLQVVDSDSPPRTFQQAFTLTILPPLPVFGFDTLPPGTVNRPYSAQVYARDGTLPYQWTVSGGALPPGLSLQTSGSLTGTPTAAGSFTFNASVTDSASPPQSAARNYTIVIDPKALGRNDSIATATTAAFGVDVASLSPFADPPDSTTSTPDTDFYRFFANAGSKVTVSVGSNAYVDPVIEILDANGQRYKTCRDVGDDNPTLSFIVKDPTPAAFDDECVNDDIDPTVNQSASLEFMVPGTTGTQLSFFIHVFDSSGRARPDMSYSIYVNGTVQPLVMLGTSVWAATIAEPFTTQLLNSGGTYPLTWQMAPGSGPLPPGLTISSNQTGNWYLSGTPAAKGTFTFTLQVSDSANPPQLVTRDFTISVYDPLRITASSFPDFHIGQPYSYVLPTSGAIPPLTWSNFGYPWCCIGLKSTTTGEWVPQGTATTGTYSTYVTVTDSTGRSWSKMLTLTAVP
jgi:hypothetical protein